MVNLVLETEKKKIGQIMKKLTIDSSTEIEEAVRYLCHNVMLLPPNDPPINGVDAVKARMIEDSQAQIHAIGGKQLNVEVSEKADLAWEYGSYYIQYSEENEGVHGYYLSIFRKEKGDWKLQEHSWSEIFS
jgi:ketosteroid isomerase-like protein